MSDERAVRINAVAFGIIEDAVIDLTAEGAPDATIDAEVLAAIGIAYAIACKIKGYTFEQIEPILRNSFDAPRKLPVNAKGGNT